MSNTTQPRAAPKGWTTDQERHLYTLRATQKGSWPAIATMLNRTVTSCQQKYYHLKRQHEGANVGWDENLDRDIIDGRRRGLSIQAISVETNHSSYAIADRWNYLMRFKLVPEDVLAVWRRKEDVVWTEEEDRMILGLWIAGKDDVDIVKLVKFPGKNQQDVMKRRRNLTGGKENPLYVEMLNIGGGMKKKEKFEDDGGGVKIDEVVDELNGLDVDDEIMGGMDDAKVEEKYL